MEQKIDEAFLQVSHFLEDLSELDGQVYDIHENEELVSMQIESAKMEIPVQLEVLVDEQGKVVLGMAPPLYYVETSHTPVFHQLKVSLERNTDHGKKSNLES